MGSQIVVQIIDIVVQALAIISSAAISIYITNKQIRNQNKETYRPRLKVKSIINRQHDSTRSEYMSFSYYYKKTNKNFNSYITIILENIGNGLANDITFYDLIMENDVQLAKVLIMNIINRFSLQKKFLRIRHLIFHFG